MPEPWFYLSPLPREPGGTVELDVHEARHARASRRLGKGDRIVLFDGEGLTAHAELLEIGRDRSRVKLLAHDRHEPPQPRLHLASALPKGDRQATLVAMATQLGMTDFTPLLCARSVATPGASAPERWLRICREACKQSRRPHLPRLWPASTPADLVESAIRGARVLLLHPTGAPASRLVTAPGPRECSEIRLLIGPEAGFVEDEVEQARANGAEPVSLGDGILRTETAALAALAIFGLLTDR